ncbi:MAG: hypothetical protein ACK4M7_09160, partial [Burkholderiales bacterium]
MTNLSSKCLSENGRSCISFKNLKLTDYVKIALSLELSIITYIKVSRKANWLENDYFICIGVNYMKKYPVEIFKAYDIRGVVETHLTP